MARVFDIGAVDLPDLAYPPLDAAQVPHREHLVGAFFLGLGEMTGERDWSGKSNHATLVGEAAEFGTGYASLSGDGYLQTSVAEELEMTYVVVMRRSPGSLGNVGIIGNFSGAANAGISLYLATTNTVQANTSRVGGVSGSFSVASNAAEWGLYTLQVPWNAQARLRNETGDNTGTSSYAADREVSASGPIRIGRINSPSHVNGVDEALVLIYDAALTDKQTIQAAQFARAHVAQVGIVV